MTGVSYFFSQRLRQDEVRSLLVSSILSTRERVRFFTVEYCIATLVNRGNKLAVDIEE